MQPLVRAALAVAVLAAISGLAAERATLRSGAPPEGEPRGADGPARMPCGPREIPEGDACVPLPDAPPGASGAPAPGAPPAEEPSADDAPAGRIPRRPDRPADVASLRLPVEGAAPLGTLGAPVRGADPDLSVLRLRADRGAPVAAVALEGQDVPFEILAVETLPGRGLSVLAHATSPEPGRREAGWLVLWGSLDGAGPTVARGAKLADGAVVGFAGGGAGPDAEVRLEVRRLRAGIDVRVTPLAELLSDAASIPIDVRNVLPAR